jgi:hypothetical protein
MKLAVIKPDVPKAVKHVGLSNLFLTLFRDTIPEGP